jgi:hypothetical protein
MIVTCYVVDNYNDIYNNIYDDCLNVKDEKNRKMI